MLSTAGIWQYKACQVGIKVSEKCTAAVFRVGSQQITSCVSNNTSVGELTIYFINQKNSPKRMDVDWTIMFKHIERSTIQDSRTNSNGQNQTYVVCNVYWFRKTECIICMQDNHNLYEKSIPPINPTPRPYLRVLWIRTLLYPGSRGRR